MMKNSKPIGVFDSGVGGLSVWKELVKILPGESVIYYADTANCPYGPRKQNEIIGLTQKVVDFLIGKDCKLIIVACNTATAAAIEFLRANYDVPFIGMEPAVKPASLSSKTKSIAVLATEGTFNGKLYIETSQKFAKNINLNIKVGDKLVDIVEKGLINEPETEEHLKNLIKPLIEQNIDHLVLGCTHYPFLTGVLKKILPENVTIVDPAPAVIRQTKKILEQKKLLSNSKTNPDYQFYSSGNVEVLEKLVEEITNKKYPINRI